MKKNNIKKAYSLIEVFITLTIVTFILTISMHRGGKLSRHVEVIALKNANSTFKTALANILTNSAYYAKEDGLTDERTAHYTRLTGETTDTQGEYKLQSLLYRELEIDDTIANKIDCYALVANGSKVKKSSCYRAENGVIYSIPKGQFTDNPDENKKNLTTIKNSSHVMTHYLPVTIYPNAKHIDAKDFFYEYAIVIGIRADGDTNIINTMPCSKKENKNLNQCKFVEYLGSSKYEDDTLDVEVADD